MNIKKQAIFNTLIGFSKSTMNLGYTFLAFAVFPLVHETIAFYLGWKAREQINLELNDYFYYNIVCVIASTFCALLAALVLRCMSDDE